MKLYNRAYFVEKFFFYLTILAGFLGVVFFSVDLGLFTLFPYRVFLVLLWIFFILHILVQDKLLLPRFRVKRYFYFFGVWLVYAVLTLAWAKDSAAAIEDVVFLAMAISVIFFTVYYARKEKDFEMLYWLWVIVFFGFILLGFWEHLTGNHLSVSKLFHGTNQQLMHIPTGVFHNQNNYAMALALNVPFASALTRYTKRLITTFFGLVLVLLASYLIFITGSRASIFALFLEIIFFWLLFLNTKGKTKFGFGIIGLVILLILIVPGFFQIAQQELLSNLNSLVVQTKGFSDSIRIRFNLLRNGLLFFRSTWGLGVGAGNAEYWMANFGRYSTEGILNPHNWWLEIFINYGVFISFGYLVVYLGLIWNLWKSWLNSSDDNKKMISEALILALVGFFLASMSPSSVMAFKPQWILFAFSLAFLNFDRKERI